MATTLPDALVEKIRRLAAKGGFSRRDIARRCHVSHTAVNQILAGNRHAVVPRWPNILAALLADCENEFHPRTPVEATPATPGSGEKIKILRSRLEHGEHLHHPDDPGYCEDGGGERVPDSHGDGILVCHVTRSRKDPAA